MQTICSSTILCLILAFPSYAQDFTSRKTVRAVRIQQPINIDGQLSEAVWQGESASNFTQRDPDEGAPASQQTEIWIAYDDAALYVGARMHDSAPDSIVARVGRRDADLNSDWIFVGLDPYYDKRTGFFFAVGPAGTIKDGTISNDEETDDSWDGVWDVATTIDSDGWSAEFRIPYSQLRFPKLEDYVWGINFIRTLDRRREESWYVLTPKKENGLVSRFPDLIGIRNIEPPRKFEALPYTASTGKFLQHEKDDPFKGGSGFSQSVGADFKLGLGTNMTLNATINPDFGQVEVDPAVINLTQYETYFEEKRPFFIEGADFFSFGRGGVNNNWNFNWSNPTYFYSRRIGRAPAGQVQHVGFENIPDRTQIIGAAKLTGKIAEGWSFGAMQALTAREYGKVNDGEGNQYADVVEPLTYYGVVRSLKEFDEGSRAIGFVGTATMRDLHRDYLVDAFNRRAYAFGLDGWTNIDSDRMWVTTAWISGTRIYGTQQRMIDLQRSAIHYFQRPEADYVGVDSQATHLAGYAGRISINKQKGNLKFNAGIGTISPGFNTNDLGIQFRTDVINSHLVVGYQWFDPDGTFRRKSFNVAAYRSYDFGRRKTGEGYFMFYNMQFLNYVSLSGNLGFFPASLDTRLTRGGPPMMGTNGYSMNFNGSTDSRKDVVFRGGIWVGRTESGGYAIGSYTGAEWKPTTRLTIAVWPEITYDVTIAQWITRVDDPAATHTYGTRYLFGRLDRRDFSATIRVDWTFNPKLSLQIFAQPLFSVGSYTDFIELAQPGTYTFNRYGINGSTIVQVGNEYRVDPDGSGPAETFTFGNPDYNFKSIRANMILRWEYMPGSTAFLVWSHDRANSDDPGTFRFGRDVSNLLASTPNNVLVLKIAYWLNP